MHLHTPHADAHMHVRSHTICENIHEILYNGIYVMLYNVPVQTCVEKKTAKAN